MNDHADLVPGMKARPADELATASPLAEMAAKQDVQAQQYAIEFLSKVIRIRGVAVSRQDYLRQELRKLGASDAQIGIALDSTPLSAGIALDRLDELAASTIDFETRKSAAMSFAAGLPGGFAMFATVPADITQYYVHALRIIQKLAYLYGWQDLLSGLDEADDETVGRLALFFGVMMGVGGAATTLSSFASQVAGPAVRKQIAKKALTKTVWYTPMKKTLAFIGVKVTKDSFAKTVTKAVPVAGGVISGSMTLVVLKSQSVRLLVHLREMPPPGVDAAEYASVLAQAGSIEQTPTIAELTRSAASGLKSAAAGASDVAAGAAESASDLWGASLALQRRIRGLRGRSNEDDGRTGDDGEEGLHERPGLEGLAEILLDEPEARVVDMREEDRPRTDREDQKAGIERGHLPRGRCHDARGSDGRDRRGTGCEADGDADEPSGDEC